MERPEPGQAVEVAPGLVRVLAPNPSPMTFWGTNTFLVGEREVAVVDPGPVDAGHLAAILAAARGPVTAILITHPHGDHSPLARVLSERTGAPVYGFGPADAGLSPVMRRLAEAGVGGGEGVDAGFCPDRRLRDGDWVAGDGWRLTAVATPGHFAGHLAFRGADWMLSGDHAMAWSSTFISPPHGDVAAFLATSRALIARAPARMFPAHGPELDDPVGRLEWLVAHREARAAAILDALGPAPVDLPTLTARVYTDVPPAMLPAAERNVFAHLIDFAERSLVHADPDLRPDAAFRRT